MPNSEVRARRILIFRIGNLGDTVISLPALWSLRRYFPNAHLTFLTQGDLKADHITGRQVLPATGLIDEWLTYPSLGSYKNGLDVIRWWIDLRKRHFDTLIYLAPRLRTKSQLRRDLIFFRLAGIHDVIGHRGLGSFPPARPYARPLPVVEHEADHLLERLAASGIPVPESGARELDLALTQKEHENAESWLRANVPGYPEKVKLVGVCPGSKWLSKVWPEERFAELGRRLITEMGLYPIAFGGPEDVALSKRLIDAWGSGANAAGALDVRSAAAVLARAHLYVGNDTGAMHLAAAVGTPCVVTFSAQDWPGRWYPYGSQHRVLRRSVACEGCLLEVCTSEGLRCLKEISVDEVLRACSETLLSQSPHAHQYPL